MIEQWIGNRIGSLQQPMDEHARSAWGKAASYAGIMCNVLLFAGKLAAGLISGSVIWKKLCTRPDPSTLAAS